MQKQTHLAPPGMRYCSYKHHPAEKPRLLPLSEFNGSYCKDCYRTYHTTWIRENKQPIQARIMAEAMEHYGTACENCGISDSRVLIIYPMGARGQLQQLYHLRSLGWPDKTEDEKTVRILCLNCRSLCSS